MDSTLHIGCDSADDVQSKKIGRPFGPKEVSKALKISKRYNIDTNIYFIYDLPYQTKKTISKTSQFIKENQKYVEKYIIYRFLPLPMSAFSNKMKGRPSNVAADWQEVFKLIKDINTQKKQKYLNKKIEAYIIESYSSGKDEFIAFPASNGPLIKVHHAKKYLRKKVELEITKIISDRLIEGRILRCLN